MKPEHALVDAKKHLRRLIAASLECLEAYEYGGVDTTRAEFDINAAEKWLAEAK